MRDCGTKMKQKEIAKNIENIKESVEGVERALKIKETTETGHENT